MQCGRAARTRQCDPGNSWGWHWQAWRRIIGATLAGFTAQSKRVFLPPSARVHRKTRQQGWSRLLEPFHFSEHVFQRLWSTRGVFRCAACDGANTLPKWQRQPTTGFALLAGDEGEPFAQEVPLGESEEVHNSKREPTHRGEVVRRPLVEPFGAGKSRGTQWLLKMSHCKASFSVACAKLGAHQCLRWPTTKS